LRHNLISAADAHLGTLSRSRSGNGRCGFRAELGGSSAVPAACAASVGFKDEPWFDSIEEFTRSNLSTLDSRRSDGKGISLPRFRGMDLLQTVRFAAKYAAAKAAKCHPVAAFGLAASHSGTDPDIDVAIDEAVAKPDSKSCHWT